MLTLKRQKFETQRVTNVLSTMTEKRGIKRRIKRSTLMQPKC
jgi:hypothetical protein